MSAAGSVYTGKINSGLFFFFFSAIVRKATIPNCVTQRGNWVHVMKFLSIFLHKIRPEKIKDSSMEHTMTINIKSPIWGDSKTYMKKFSLWLWMAAQFYRRLTSPREPCPFLPVFACSVLHPALAVLPPAPLHDLCNIGVHTSSINVLDALLEWID